MSGTDNTVPLGAPLPKATSEESGWGKKPTSDPDDRGRTEETKDSDFLEGKASNGENGNKALAAGAGLVAKAAGSDSTTGKVAKAVEDSGGDTDALKEAAKDRAKQEALYYAADVVAPGSGEVIREAKKVNDKLNESEAGTRALAMAERGMSQRTRRVVNWAGFGAVEKGETKAGDKERWERQAKRDAKRAAHKKRFTTDENGRPVPIEGRKKGKFKVLFCAVGAAVALMLIVTMLGLAEFNQDYALEKKSSEGTEVPKQFVDIYRSAANNHDVPWTVLAALAKVQTDHGARSPYDQKDYGQDINRDPTRVELGLGGNVPGVEPVSAVGAGDAAAIVAFAMTYLGTPYVWGGNEPGGFDCSGLMQYVYDHFGIHIPRIASDQQAGGVPVPMNQLQPGDLVFYGSPAHHVGMYIGNGMMVHAPHTGDVVRLQSITSWPPDGGARRYFTKTAGTAAPAGSSAGLTTGLVAAGPVSAPQPTLPYVTPAVPDAIKKYGVEDLVPGIAAAGKKGECFNDDPNAKVSISPCTVPAIGAKPDEGSGIFLVRPDAPDLGDTDLQNVRDSAEYVAKQLWKARQRQEKADHVNAGTLSFEKSDAFWAKAVKLLPLADPTGAIADCGVPTNVDGSEATAQEIITAVFTCQLSNAGQLYVATDGTRNRDGTITFAKKTGSEAVDELVANALTVAWGFSRWGTAPCDNTATYAGVFPLTKEQAAGNDDPDRCDKTKNITAAAKIIAGGEQVPIVARSNTEGPFAPMFGGWAAFPYVLGNDANRARLAKDGPGKPWEMPEACHTALNTWAESIIRRDASPFTDLTADSAKNLTKQGRDAVDMAYRNLANPADNPACAGASAHDMLDVQIASVNELEESLSEPGNHQSAPAADPSASATPSTSTATPDPTTGPLMPVDKAVSTLKGMVAYLSVLQGDLGAAGDVKWGVDSALQRLSLGNQNLVTPQPPQPIYAQNPGLDGDLVVQYAIYYGGILPGDKRAGTPPSGLANASGGVALGIVIERIDDKQYSLWPTPPDVVNMSSCGTPANTAHTARPFFKELWEKMCTAASSAGVKMQINSSTRSKADQQRLYDLYGPSRAAKPGSGNHERGVAFDVEQTPQVRAWMHNIVGCYDPVAQSYTPYSAEIPYLAYADALEAHGKVKDVTGKEQATCASGQHVIKRVQTYGLLFPLCGTLEERDQPVGIRCTGNWPGGLMREDWHIEAGQEIKVAGSAATGVNFNLAQCGSVPAVNVNDPWSMQKATYVIFRCAMKQAGFDSKSPTPRANGTGPQVFHNLSEQISSEAVVVGYCESSYSKQNALGNNAWGYGGVFQFGDSETKRFIPGGNKFDPTSNIIGATRYFLSGVGKNRWDGWGPWAPVNTTYGGANVGVKVPVLPRFPSTRPGYVGVYHPGPLPAWALNPLGVRAFGGCSAAFKGEPWPSS
jgi:hypothetical protein